MEKVVQKSKIDRENKQKRRLCRLHQRTALSTWQRAQKCAAWSWAIYQPPSMDLPHASVKFLSVFLLCSLTAFTVLSIFALCLPCRYVAYEV